MTNPATSQRPDIAIQYLEPTTLLVDTNVRIATNVDKDFVASTTQIQRRTRMRRPAVDAAVTVIGSDLAKAATARYDFLTLPQAAALAEFEDDTEAVKALVVAAKEGEGRFHHALQRLRDSRDKRAAQAEARSALEATGLTVVDAPPSWDHLLSYLLDDQGETLSEESHRNCPGHAGFLRFDWVHDGTEQAEDDESDETDDEDDHYRPVWQPVYLCTDPQANGHKTLSPSRSTKTKPTGEAAEAAKAERREVIVNNKSWRSAEVVRREWLTNLLARKTAPKGARRSALCAR